MVAVHIRQEADDPLAAPSVDGFSGAVTVGAPDPTDTVFGADTEAPRVSDSYTIPLVATETAGDVTGTPDIHIPTPSRTSESTPASTATPASNAASGAESGSIPLGTTIGICIGALGGALFVVLLGLWLYKRSTPNSRRRGTPRSSPHDRAPSQNWKKLGETGDKWEGMDQMNEAPHSSENPDLKLTMFKKSPSQRTAYTSKTAFTTFDSEPVAFAQYHPALAEQMASSEDVSTPSLHPAPFARQNAPESWISTNSQVTTASFLSLRPSHVEGSMSPSVDMAIPTPSVVSGEVPHRWQSAEVVVDYGEHTPQSAEFVDNPFADQQSSSRSNKRVSEADPVLEEITNPFSDDNKMPQVTHMSADSMASATSNGRAIQSLIAALHDPAFDERARVESMQPSVMSQYTDDGDLSTPRPSYFFDKS
jgi:hypothetical protein